MSFTEHLGEFRTRLIRISISIVVTFLLGFAFSNQLLKVMQWPVESGIARYNNSIRENAPKDDKGQPILSDDMVKKTVWTTLTPQAPILVKMKLAMYFALILSFPVFVFQICAFIFPGLKSNERRIVMFVLGGASVLAVGGVITAYLGVLPFALPILLTYAPPDIVTQLELQETISFIVTLIVGFAIAFQFPMFVVAAVMLGIIEVSTLTKHRRIAIVGIAIISAVLTPPDVYSMTAMMLPLFGLYELSILVARIVTWRRDNKPKSTDITTV